MFPVWTAETSMVARNIQTRLMILLGSSHLFTTQVTMVIVHTITCTTSALHGIQMYVFQYNVYPTTIVLVDSSSPLASLNFAAIHTKYKPKHHMIPAGEGWMVPDATTFSNQVYSPLFMRDPSPKQPVALHPDNL
jgi:hypothetical protein